MGVMKVGKNAFWTDSAQDEIDDAANKVGHDFEKTYTNKKLKDFKSKILKSKKVREKFDEAFDKDVGRLPKSSEFKSHINTSLGLGDDPSPLAQAIGHMTTKTRASVKKVTKKKVKLKKARRR